MLALSQTFLDNLAAVAASLAGASGIHFHHHDASSFSLASQGCQKAAPGGIGNRTTESAVPQHPLDVVQPRECLRYIRYCVIQNALFLIV